MERYDFVVVGAGHNGLTIAAYLSKSGYKVAVAESRLEAGGGMDFAEPKPGFVIQPHAMMNFGNAAPGWEQLELFKFGIRMAPFKGPAVLQTSDDRVLVPPGVYGGSQNNLREWSPHDADMWETMFAGAITPHLKDLVRSVFWVAPWPRDLDYGPTDLPWYQMFNQVFSGMLTPDWTRMSLVEIFDTLLECEPLKCYQMYNAYYCGAGPHWAGQALPSFAGLLLGMQSHSAPVGGMHMYAHALIRCACHHGTKIFSNSPVDEIIVKDGRAVGVRLADNAQYKEKIIMADKAVISAVDTQQTFLRLVGKDHLDRSFLQRVKDIDLKGGSLYYSHIAASDYPKFKGQAAKVIADMIASNGLLPSAFAYPMDNMKTWWDFIGDLEARRITPDHATPKLGFVAIVNNSYDDTLCPKGKYVISPIMTSVPPPEYHSEGVNAVDRKKAEIDAQLLELLYRSSPNMKGKIIGQWSDTALEQEFRNAGFCGGTWYGPAQSRDHWWDNRPLPELSRYRAPIDGLYLCHQSQYPGGFCLMAVGYNLMHILIDDGLVEPKSWWYPSPWHVKDGSTKIPRIEDIKK